jgi:tellurite resistance protein
MSPEQVYERPLDGRSDIYSLGIVTYEALTGQRPFPDGSVFHLLRNQAESAPPDPRHKRSDLPVATAAAVLRALAKDPAERPQSAGEFAAELRDSIAALSFRRLIPPVLSRISRQHDVAPTDRLALAATEPVLRRVDEEPSLVPASGPSPSPSLGRRLAMGAIAASLVGAGALVTAVSLSGGRFGEAVPVESQRDEPFDAATPSAQLAAWPSLQADAGLRAAVAGGPPQADAGRGEMSDAKKLAHVGSGAHSGARPHESAFGGPIAPAVPGERNAARPTPVTPLLSRAGPTRPAVAERPIPARLAMVRAVAWADGNLTALEIEEAIGPRRLWGLDEETARDFVRTRPQSENWGKPLKRREAAVRTYGQAYLVAHLDFHISRAEREVLQRVAEALQLSSEDIRRVHSLERKVSPGVYENIGGMHPFPARSSDAFQLRVYTRDRRRLLDARARVDGASTSITIGTGSFEPRGVKMLVTAPGYRPRTVSVPPDGPYVYMVILNKL